jgi:hypothetical protein
MYGGFVVLLKTMPVRRARKKGGWLSRLFGG